MQRLNAKRALIATVAFVAACSAPGTYRGRFTIVGGHRSDDVYPMVVVVTER